MRPFDLNLSVPFGYYVVVAERALTRPNTAAFFDWIIAQTKPPPQERG